MKEYDIKITEVLEKTVQVQADSREEAEAIASENWNNSLYEMDSAEDYADVSFHAGEERDISPPEIMDVLLVSPGEYPREVQVGTELEDLQEAVGGMIECVYPFDEQVGLIVNEEGKFNGSLLNRALYSEDGKMVDVIAGDFLVVGLTEDNFGSLTPEQMQRHGASHSGRPGETDHGKEGQPGQSRKKAEGWRWQGCGEGNPFSCRA